MSKYIELDSGTHTIGSFYPADRGGTVVAENSHPIVCFPDISYSAFKTAFMATAEGAYVDVEPLHDRPPAGMVRNPPSRRI